MGHPARPLPVPQEPPEVVGELIVGPWSSPDPVTPEPLELPAPVAQPAPCPECGYLDHVLRRGDLRTGQSVLVPVSCQELQALRARVDRATRPTPVRRTRAKETGWTAVWARRVGWVR